MVDNVIDAVARFKKTGEKWLLYPHCRDDTNWGIVVIEDALGDDMINTLICIACKGETAVDIEDGFIKQ